MPAAFARLPLVRGLNDGADEADEPDEADGHARVSSSISEETLLRSPTDCAHIILRGGHDSQPTTGSALQASQAVEIQRTRPNGIGKS